MVFFITVLRAIAACIIINSHYEGIYPSDLLANGGLLGNALFFAISGYCLANIKEKLTLSGFLKWYGKRIRRIYLPSTIITIVFILIDYNRITAFSDFIYYFIYPTRYAFLGAIILLYIPFFILLKVNWTNHNLVAVMMTVAGIAFIIYIIGYDKSFYHIDAVNEPFIFFIYFECMLFGAWFRHNKKKYIDNHKITNWIYAVSTVCIYVACKILLSKSIITSNVQIVNQFCLFLVITALFTLFSGLNSQLEQLPNLLKQIISRIAAITLELYLVQAFIVIKVREMKIFFPVNWILLTVLIFVCAFLLHYFCRIIDQSVMGKRYVEKHN